MRTWDSGPARPRASSVLSMFMLFSEPLLGASCAADIIFAPPTRACPIQPRRKQSQRLSLCGGHTEPWSAGPVSRPHPCPSPVAHENRQRRPVLHGIHRESMCSRTLKHDDQGDTIKRWWHDFTTTLIRVNSAEEGGMRRGHGLRDEAEGGEGVGKRG